MKTLLVVFVVFALLVIVPSISKGQSISVGFGPTFLVDKSDVALHKEVLGEGVGGNDDWILQISYSHLIKDKYWVNVSYSRYPDRTLFNFKNDFGVFGDYGWWGSTQLSRLELGFGYDLLKTSKWLFILRSQVGLLFSKPLGYDLGGYVPKESLPTGFLQLEPAEGISYQTTQLVPSIGVKFGYAFWNRLELFFDISQVWGHKRTQQIRLKYSYKGKVQPDAINYTDGTGRFYMIGIGYRFGEKWTKNK